MIKKLAARLKNNLKDQKLNLKRKNRLKDRSSVQVIDK